MENEENKAAVIENRAEPVKAEAEEAACACCCEAAEEKNCCCEAAEEKNCCCEAAEEKREFKPRPVIEVTQEMLDATVKNLQTMFNYLGLEGSIKAEKRPSKVNLLVSSSDAGRIIGRKGQTLDSLQLLLNRIMQKTNIDFPKIYIDIDGYSSKQSTTPEGKFRRERGEHESFRRDRGPRREHGGPRAEEKEDILRQQAIDAAKEVRHWGEPVTLPAMNSHDRRIIHVTLENSEDVKTESIGEGAMKQVVISLKK